jgi:uncharacterized protein YidB (DUF937 family)
MSMTTEQVDAMFKRVFEEHHEGAMCLDILVSRFAKNACTVGGIDAILTTYKQAGAREVLDHVVNRINRANGVQADPNEQEE